MIKPRGTELPPGHLLHATKALYIILGLKIINVSNKAESVTQL